MYNRLSLFTLFQGMCWDKCTLRYWCRDNFVNAPSQWETTSHLWRRLSLAGRIHKMMYIMAVFGLCWWFNARLWYLQYISFGDTAVCTKPSMYHVVALLYWLTYAFTSSRCCEWGDVYGEGDFKPGSAWLWLTIINNISQVVSRYLPL